MWISKLGQVAKGTDAAFGDQLKQIGLSEGARLDAINKQIAKLEQEWDILDSQGTGHNRQQQIQQELVKLRREKENWNKLWAATNEETP
jgi:acetoin utilization deacetylase AcuC-like enzyme